MKARIEGFIDLKHFIEEGEGLEEEIAEFDMTIDLNKHTGEHLEISFKKETIKVFASGISMEFPTHKVRFYNQQD